eukprot:CAMPEP_0205815170 /NCGR_PEP_ID=MMETSP0205-20121125/20719_1 /ASSEMBLY_ACC=CAM_ASM_000278 /TAXON_ID=36767 /ORGANISM="Euplotes focardii, Strain TN1" /LENGTH=168 /DNA_ID=CAMNT_0053100771 /DNA_START=95 /DNA_END=598 /DNA_ORIENTATION=+
MDHLGTERSGAILAGTWAALVNLGNKGYAEKTKKIYDTTVKIREAIESMPELKLHGPNNSLNMVCFDGITVSPIKVSGKLNELYNWHLSECQYPCVVHLLVSDSNVERCGKFIEEVKEALKVLKQDPDSAKTSPYQKLYGASQVMTDTSIMSEFLYIVLDAGYAASKD